MRGSAAMTVQVYRSPREDWLYLFVDARRGLDDVPEALLARFGEPVHVMELELTPERRLARADPAQVMAAIGEQGFYLQLPPAPEERP